MERFSREDTRAKPDNDLTDAEKLNKAIKKAKSEKARKVLNTSHDRSLGLMRKKRKRRQNESFVMRQASALERKNREIITALVKARQYTTQLEKINHQFKEREMFYAMKITSYKRKFEDMKALHEQMKSKVSSKDDILDKVQGQLMNLLDVIQMSKTETRSDAGITQTSWFLNKPQRVRCEKISESNSEQSSVEDANRDFLTGPREISNITQRGRNVSSSPERELDVLDEDESEDLEHDFDDDDSGRLSSHDSQSPEKLSDVTKEEQEDQLQSIAFMNENVDSNLSEDKHLENSEMHEDTIQNLDLNVSFSSTSSRSSASSECYYADEKPTETEKPAQNADYAEAANKTDYSCVSMDLSRANISNALIEMVQKENVGTDDVDADHAGNSKEKTKQTKKAKSILQNMKHNQRRRATYERKKRLEDSAHDKSSYDFFSCSGDSFVLDPTKCIKLNSSRSLSPDKPRMKPKGSRLSNPESKENEQPLQRCRRRTAPVSYAEPKVNAKLRRGDKISDSSLFQTLSPKAKKKNRK